MEDQKLATAIKQAQTGEADGFKVILEMYANRLYGYFYRSVQNHHDSEDLLSKLGLKLVKNIKKYDDRGRFEAWLFSIAANLVRDRIRKKKSRPAILSFSQSGKDDQEINISEPVDLATAEKYVIAAEDNIALHNALIQLDDTSRELILQRFFGQLSFKELSERFDLPMGTVLARVHRGIKLLKSKLTDNQNE